MCILDTCNYEHFLFWQFIPVPITILRVWQFKISQLSFSERMQNTNYIFLKNVTTMPKYYMFKRLDKKLNNGAHKYFVFFFESFSLTNKFCHLSEQILEKFYFFLEKTRHSMVTMPTFNCYLCKKTPEKNIWSKLPTSSERSPNKYLQLVIGWSH